MAIKNKKELFLTMLSNIKLGTERSKDIYREFTKIAENPSIVQILEARAYLSENTCTLLNEVFHLVGEKPASRGGRAYDLFVEDFRRDLEDIHHVEAKELFVLTKAIQLNQLQAAELSSLIEAADLTGHYGVGMILESCLADKLAFTERTRRFIRHALESKMDKKIAA